MMPHLLMHSQRASRVRTVSRFIYFLFYIKHEVFDFLIVPTHKPLCAKAHRITGF